MSIVLQGSTSGSITLQEPAVAGSTVLSLPATSGTLITTGSTGQVIPKAALPTGSVLQVVQATTTTPVTIASTTFVDTGLSASITPTSATSKILVLTSQAGISVIGSNASRTNIIQLVRGSTGIFDFQWETNGAVGGNGFRVDPYSANIAYLDSPATTSSTTYKTQARGDSTADSLQTRWQQGNRPSSMILLEIAA